VDTCVGYLQAKREFLGYDTALAAGWPIATGVSKGRAGTLSATGSTSPAPAGQVVAVAVLRAKVAPTCGRSASASAERECDGSGDCL
jgi:hypothetical protein